VSEFALMNRVGGSHVGVCSQSTPKPGGFSGGGALVSGWAGGGWVRVVSGRAGAGGTHISCASQRVCGCGCVVSGRVGGGRVVGVGAGVGVRACSRSCVRVRG
jgi:hypothetical protein